MPVILRRATLRPLWSCKDHTDTLIQSRLGEKHNCGLARLWQAHFIFLPVRSYVQEADIAWTRNGHLATRHRIAIRVKHVIDSNGGNDTSLLGTLGGNEMDNARSYLVRSSLSSGFCICLSELPAENMETEEKE